jgi:hypothetical protein
MPQHDSMIYDRLLAIDSKLSKETAKAGTVFESTDNGGYASVGQRTDPTPSRSLIIAEGE